MPGQKSSSRDAYHVLLRIKRISADAARRDLAASLAAEASARTAFDAADAAIRAEIADTSGIGNETLARWLDAARGRVAAAEQASRNAEADSAQARQALADARAASEALNRYMQKRRAARALERAREAQHELDEVARTRALVASA